MNGNDEETDDDNDADDDELERQEGFRYLLGGLSIQDVSAEAWDHDSCGDSDNDDSKSCDGKRRIPLVASAKNQESNNNENNATCHDNLTSNEAGGSSNNSTKSSRVSSQSTIQNNGTTSSNKYQIVNDENNNEVTIMFRHAYTCSGYCTPQEGRVERPPVVPVQFLHNQQQRGKGLISTKPIRKGETIYTERAAVATQLPQDLSVVRACQFCFRSMEPASSLVLACSHSTKNGDKNNKDDYMGDMTTLTPSPPRETSYELPLKELWPVPEFEFAYSTTIPLNQNGNKTLLRIDKWKRMHCTVCDSWFCSEYCLNELEREVGNHCLSRQALDLLLVPNRSRSNNQTRTTEFTNKNNRADNNGSHKDDEEEDEDDGDDQAQAPVALATRMFAMAVHQYRNSPKYWEETCVWNGLCGSAADLTFLELGSRFRVATASINDSKTTTCGDDEILRQHKQLPPESFAYTLKHLYQRLTKLFDVTLKEQTAGLSLNLLETLACMAARNGFGYSTQSPFVSYYQALLRQAGRGSAQHEALKSKVATALGSPNGTLERGMDRQVSNRVVPQLVALFPLTARINHSCCIQPPADTDRVCNHNNNLDNNPQEDLVNAEVQNQVFVDCHMDLVATRNIAAGQELLISYLGPRCGKTNTVKRRRELKAKYLFDCTCSKCNG
ncbi:hypothetical protein ACA910_016123 [Epithemia clementina (nom. ined.)]